MQNDIAIKVEGLSKSYKLYNKPVDRLKESLNPFGRRYSTDFHALNDVSFSIKKGETVGIIGKNGSGKSTLLKIITGIVTPSAGLIEIDGKISALLELGAGFNPEFTGLENIYMNGTIMGYSRDEMEQKIADILQFADIGDFIYQPVKMYSSGMFARLAFAVAINVEPDILIVDEALSVGDIFFQNKCFKKFRELKDKNVTILFVSHDMGSIKQMTSRVLWLHEGMTKMFNHTDVVCGEYFNEQLKVQNMLNQDLNITEGKSIATIKTVEGRVCFPKLVVTEKNLVSDEVIIKSFFIMDYDGNQVDCLKVDASYTAVLVAEFTKAMSNIIFGCVLENNKGIQLISMNSFIHDDEKLVDVKNAGIVKVEFNFVLPRFLKGEYLLSPAVAQGQQKHHIMLTWLSGASKIQIENMGYNLSLVEIPANIHITEYKRDCVQFV